MSFFKMLKLACSADKCYYKNYNYIKLYVLCFSQKAEEEDHVDYAPITMRR